MKKVVNFGEDVEGYNILVLNKREIRAAAGILFLFMLIALKFVLFKGNFMLIKYLVIVFLTDFIIRFFINPKYSPTLIFGRMIVSRQVAEYVGAAQKKFSWIIGLVLAGIMFTLIVIVNSYSPITGIICLICLIFLFFESAFGICLGCLVYRLFYKKKAQYCPGEICEVKNKQEIQEISGLQILIILGFAIYILLAIFLLNDSLSKIPGDLWEILNIK